MSDLRDLYQEVILEHSKNPRNFHELPQSTCPSAHRPPPRICSLIGFLPPRARVFSHAARPRESAPPPATRAP